MVNFIPQGLELCFIEIFIQLIIGCSGLFLNHHILQCLRIKDRVNQSCYSLGYRLQLLWQRSNCTIGYSLTIFGSDVLLTVNIAVVLQIDDDTACFGFADGVYLFANLDLLASEIGNSCFGCTFTKYITSLTLQGCGKVGITFIGYHR